MCGNKLMQLRTADEEMWLNQWSSGQAVSRTHSRPVCLHSVTIRSVVKPLSVNDDRLIQHDNGVSSAQNKGVVSGP